MITRARFLTAAIGVLFATGSAWAQPLGTFKWQLQPYCNIISVSVVGQGANYTLDGTDEMCGATQKASVNGEAFPNPDGTIGFGLTIVPPSGADVHIKASINLVTLGGTWSDSDGNGGTFAFTPGSGTGGSPRPTRGPSPQRFSFAYDLAAGGNSSSITIPHNTPVHLVGIQTTLGSRGVGSASLLSVPETSGVPGFIEWVGLHSTAGAAIAQGFSGAAGSIIVFIDYDHCVSVQVAGTAGSGQIRIHNGCTGSRTGVVTVTY